MAVYLYTGRLFQREKSTRQNTETKYLCWPLNTNFAATNGPGLRSLGLKSPRPFQGPKAKTLAFTALRPDKMSIFFFK
jgi:hypothetical protein